MKRTRDAMDDGGSSKACAIRKQLTKVDRLPGLIFMCSQVTLRNDLT